MKKRRMIEKVALCLLSAAMIFLNLDTMVYAQDDPESTIYEAKQGITLYQHHFDVGPYCVLVNDILLTEEETKELLQSADKENLLLQKANFLLRKKPNYKTIKVDSTNIQVDISEISSKDNTVGNEKDVENAIIAGNEKTKTVGNNLGRSVLIDTKTYEIEFETTQETYTIKLNSKMYVGNGLDHSVKPAVTTKPTIPTSTPKPKPTATKKPKPTATPKPKPTDEKPQEGTTYPLQEPDDVVIIPSDVYVDNGSSRLAKPTPEATLTPTPTNIPVEARVYLPADPISTSEKSRSGQEQTLQNHSVTPTPTPMVTAIPTSTPINFLEYSYVASFSFSGIFLALVGMSIFLDIKAILWYKRKRKENRDKRCRH